MRKNDWIMIIAIMFFISVISSFSTIYIIDNKFIPRFKTVSIMEILNEEDTNYQNFLDAKLTQEEYTKSIEEKMKKIQDAINYFSNGKDILIVEEAIIKADRNNYISITRAIKDYVKK